VTIGVVATGLMYNKKYYADNKLAPPTSWNDLKDVKFRKKLVIPPMNNSYGLHTVVMMARLNGGGVRFLHAPVFMSPLMAKDAVGMMLVSGPNDIYTAVRAALEKMTGDVWYLGETPGLAASYKIFGNSMLFVIAAGVSDVFAMAKGLGIPAADALTVFSKFQPGGVIKSRGEKMARGDFSASFELTMARKDMRLMLEAADGQPMTVLPGVAKAMDAAIAKGHGKDDLGAIAAEVIK